MAVRGVISGPPPTATPSQREEPVHTYAGTMSMTWYTPLVTVTDGAACV